MNWASGIVVFVIIWWCVFFAVLPWGVRGLHESGEAIPDGAEPGAPRRPELLKKAGVTTAITAVFWLAVYLVTLSGLISFRS